MVKMDSPEPFPKGMNPNWPEILAFTKAQPLYYARRVLFVVLGVEESVDVLEHHVEGILRLVPWDHVSGVENLEESLGAG